MVVNAIVLISIVVKKPSIYTNGLLGLLAMAAVFPGIAFWT